MNVSAGWRGSSAAAYLRFFRELFVLLVFVRVHVVVVVVVVVLVMVVDLEKAGWALARRAVTYGVIGVVSILSLEGMEQEQDQ